MVDQSGAPGVQESPLTAVWETIKNFKEVIAIAISFAVGIFAFINFVATKKDVERLSCKIDIQFKTTRAAIERREKENALKGLIKESAGLPFQKDRNLLNETEYNQRLAQLNAEQKETERKMDELQKAVDAGEPFSVATVCDK